MVRICGACRSCLVIPIYRRPKSIRMYWPSGWRNWCGDTIRWRSAVEAAEQFEFQPCEPGAAPVGLVIADVDAHFFRHATWCRCLRGVGFFHAIRGGAQATGSDGFE